MIYIPGDSVLAKTQPAVRRPELSRDFWWLLTRTAMARRQKFGELTLGTDQNQGCSVKF
jgi:hypothetical protein